MPMMEFFFDTTRVVTDMLINNYPEKYPNIKFLIPHCGAMMVYIVDRLLFATEILVGMGTVPPGFDARTLFRRFYFDVAGNAAPHQLEDALDLVPSEHFTYGSDYPFTPPKAIAALGEALVNAPYLDEAKLEAIFYSNGKALFPSLG